MARVVDSTRWAAPRAFDDRADAGRRLAKLLEPIRGEDPVVLALPRGGVPVASEVAAALGAPLDVFVVRKVGHPRNPEFGLGAVAEGPLRVIDEESVASAHVTPEELEEAVARAGDEVAARTRRLRGDRPAPEVAGRTVIVVDDGLATGGTARAAARALRQRGPRRLVLAVGVGPPDTLESLAEDYDDVVCVEAPPLMFAIGAWYRDFGQVPDAEVARLLELAAARARREAPTEAPAGSDPEGAGEDPPATRATRARTAIPVEIPFAEGEWLRGDLAFPAQGRALVLFAHGSGSSRMSPRNRSVADSLNGAGVGTLLFDLLTAAEEFDRDNVFDIPLLATRLVLATEWVRRSPELRGVPLGYFGASTGAAAALSAAADLPEEISAIVSRGGRPDLAWPRLREVRAPVRLIVGGADDVVLDLNRRALEELRCEKDLTVVAGATHLFEEPGALEQVASLAVDWFTHHLEAAGTSS